MRISLESYAPHVQAELIKQELRIRPWVSAKRLWDRVFMEADRIRLGRDLQHAYRLRGTLGMWVEARGVSPIRALIEVSQALGFLSLEDYRWLLRETDESDGRRQMLAAVVAGALVLSEERCAYFQGEPIQVDWLAHDKSWCFLWELARASKMNRRVDHFQLGRKASPKNLTDRKHRLKALLPAALFSRIHRERKTGCKIDLPPENIRLFIVESDDQLVEDFARERRFGG